MYVLIPPMIQWSSTFECRESVNFTKDLRPTTVKADRMEERLKNVSTTIKHIVENVKDNLHHTFNQDTDTSYPRVAKGV